MKYYLLIIASLLMLNVHSQFQEKTAVMGISVLNTNSVHGNGVSFVDFDDDGWDDLTFTTKNQGVKFYKNNSGVFSQVYFTFSPGIPTNTDIKCPLWLDYDNDGDKDLVLTTLFNPIRIYQNNGSMSFTEVAQSIGISAESVLFSNVTAGDYDGDGCLDLYVGKYYNSFIFTEYVYANHLYKNNCDGTFTDVTLSSNIGSHVQPTLCSIWFDYDMDGDQDLFVANDKYSNQNYMYQNNGDGTFTDVSDESGAGVYMDAMTATVGDYDNDADFDLFLSNSAFSPDMVPESSYLMNYDAASQTFSNVGSSAGLGISSVGWTGQFLDYDNNTWSDLLLTTLGSGTTLESQNYFFINDEDGTFHDGSVEVGISADVDATYCAAVADYDHDGYYEYATNNVAPSYASLWHNNGGTNHWISVSVEGTISNRDGIGTRIECYAGGHEYIMYTFCGEGYMAQNSEDEIFGLASYNMVDSLVFKWPSGMVETYYDLAVNTRNHYIEGQSFEHIPAPLFYDGNLTLCDGNTLTLSTFEATAYNWSTGDTTQSIEIIEPGDYFVITTNEFGIEQYSDTVSVATVEAETPIVLPENVSCFGGNDGAITLSLESGSIESVTWENGLQGESIDSLPVGNYDYELVSTNGCIVNGSVEITGPETPVTVELMLTDVLCNGDSTGHAEVSIGGGTPGYEVNWWGENPDALFAGEYTVQVMDFNLCEVNLDFSITEPPVLDVELFTSDVHCSGEPSGQASVSISGGSPGYETNWYGENPDSLLAGNYSVEIIDSHLCTSELYFTIEQPDPMVLQLTTTDEYENTEMGTATLVLEGGVPPYSIEWSTGATNELSQNSLPAGTYFVSVTDDNGCVQTIEFEIGFVSGISSQQLMTEFSLYPVPFRSELTLRNPGRAEVEVNVTDAIGKIVFQIRGSSDYEIPLLLGSGSSGLYTVKVRSNAGVCYYHVTRQ